MRKGDKTTSIWSLPPAGGDGAEQPDDDGFCFQNDKTTMKLLVIKPLQLHVTGLKFELSDLHVFTCQIRSNMDHRDLFVSFQHQMNC